MMTLLCLAVFVAVAAASLEETCRDQATCTNIHATSAVHASALLQTKSSLGKHASFASVEEHLLGRKSAHLQETAICLPAGLQDLHLSAVRRHTALLSIGKQKQVGSEEAAHKACEMPNQPDDACTLLDTPGICALSPRMALACDIGQWTACKSSMAGFPCVAATQEGSCEVGGVTPGVGEPTYLSCELGAATSPPVIVDTPAPVAPAAVASAPLTGATATLDAAGFKATTSLCCPSEMELFFQRLLDFKGYSACSKPHVQGLMHWFSCVPEMDIQYMIDVIDSGNPCKYWALKGQTCPALSAQCEGHWCR